jgi:hypothetical protein
MLVRTVPIVLVCVGRVGRRPGDPVGEVRLNIEIK